MEPNQPNLKDALHSQTQALPAAGASNAFTGFRVPKGPSRDGFELELIVPALTALVDTETVTYELEHSSDNSTWSDVGDAVSENASTATVSGGITFVLTGSETPGTPGEVRQRFKIPSHAEEYVRLSQAVSASGGDNTAQSATLNLLS